MWLVDNISKWFDAKPKAFLINECVEAQAETEANMLRSKNVNVDCFINTRQLLYALQSKKHTGYKIGLIHENGSKYSPQILSSFIQKIDPSIQLIIYKNKDDLKNISSC